MDISKRIEFIAETEANKDWKYDQIKQLIWEVCLEVIGEDEEVPSFLSIGQDGFVKGKNKLKTFQRQRLKELLE